MKSYFSVFVISLDSSTRYYILVRNKSKVYKEGDVLDMSVQERIRAIRLIENIEKNKRYAFQLGIDATMKKSAKEKENRH